MKPSNLYSNVIGWLNKANLVYVSLINQNHLNLHKQQGGSRSLKSPQMS